MTRIAVEIELSASPGAVWDDLAHIDRHVEWMTDACAIRFTSTSTEGPGTTFDCETRIGPWRLTDRMEITSWIPGREMGVRHVGLVTGEGRFLLEAADHDRTRFRWIETLRFPWWMGGPIGGWIGGRVLAAVWRRNLRALADRFVAPDRATQRPAEPEAVAIEDHSLLSDQRTTALVTPDARITWLCLPRIDSSAVFAELLGEPQDGFFAVGPATHPAATSQSYLGDSMVLRTEWPAMRVTDYLDCSDGRPSRADGRIDLVRVVEGSGVARFEFAPRLDFGRVGTRLEARNDGLEIVSGDGTGDGDASLEIVNGDGTGDGDENGHAGPIVLRSPGVEWHIDTIGLHQSAMATVDLDAGPVTLELRCGTSSLDPDPVLEPLRRKTTAGHYSVWADRLELPSVEPEMVKRSALALKALCHGPTGAIVAAATTSLPESIGGARNWDYRYCWIRDAAMSASALVRLGSFDEAHRFLDWLLRTVESGAAQGTESGGGQGPEPAGRSDPAGRIDVVELRPLYAVDGAALPAESTIDELAGYARSRPVRVGNAADRQVQTDVFGHVCELVHRLGEAGAPISVRHWNLVERLVDAVERRWTEPDRGMWEVRSPPRHHTNSKTMCWVAVDRAVRIARDVFGESRPVWETLRDRIGSDITTRGWSDDFGSFTTAYDGRDLGASVLAVGLFGLVGGDDRRFVATVDAVEAALRTGDTVRRYTHIDGLVGSEGGFTLMTSWLIDAKILIGDLDGALALFDACVDLAGPTGLLCEEVDPANGRGLGNYPQAYSHLGLINNALNLARLRMR